ncbi:MAG TPA: hypothetical protein VMF31_00055 [Solirubrobacterales bacterium]|nr:hypothetical protein [Solirubrobacterales bacterium]
MLSVLVLLTAFAAPASAEAIKTKVTIDNTLPRLYGYVDSWRPAACSKGRQVTVYKVRGNRPDLRVGGGKTRKFRGTWQWSTKKDSGPGRFYAKANRTRRCAPATSRVVRGAAAPRGSVPLCPETSGNLCMIGTRDEPLSFSGHYGQHCPPLADSISGSCNGQGLIGPDAFAGNREANFHWNYPLVHELRLFIAAAYYVDNGSHIEGSMPGPYAHLFSVREAVAAGDGVPGRRWCTPDLPGAKPGEEGGPLSFDFINLPITAAVRFWGYMTTAGPHSC